MSVYVDLLRDMIKERRLSQKAVADEAGISGTTISLILSGKSVPSLDTFEQILDACDCKKPGFKRDYWRSITGEHLDLRELVYSLSSVEFGMLLMISGQRVQEKQARTSLIAS